MEAADLRQRFLGHFETRGHTVVPSASLIPHDPSLLFTIAGMVPFKPYFAGEEIPSFPRAVSIQKCFRAPDIDQIGTTTRHLTFFEMMGNFSFGDYFKPDAIQFAWSLITEGFGLDPDRLWITVHESDNEAEELWRDIAGVNSDRIQRLGEDNFWQMGDTGPCGPCSEIFYDKGERYGADGGPAFGGDERFVEFWNLVFMQYNRRGDGHLDPLPKKSIDTGSGFERVLAILNGVDSVFATDLFTPLLEVAQSYVGKSYGANPAVDVALRRIAEHGRAMTMLVADGVLPSNEGRGYVLRRIIRRAILASRQSGGNGDLTRLLVDATIEKMGLAYPNLVREKEAIVAILQREEESFSRTLKSGLALLDGELSNLEIAGSVAFPGATAFRLHDTHGFPLELTEELVVERGLRVDRVEYDVEMNAQRSRARAASTLKKTMDDSSYRDVVERHGLSHFVGRDATKYTIETNVVAVFTLEDGSVEVFLETTPFYAESGGQVGDTGVITSESGSVRVTDTQGFGGGLVIHRGQLVGEIFAGQFATATIDAERREAIRRNHTSTHLLHAALRMVLGDHVRQQGSLVGPDRLRFDFSHGDSFQQMQRAEILALVNGDVVENAEVETTQTTKEQAENMGALAFFGDKYGDSVRVVRAGVHSLEFCGGTHVNRLGDIGQIQIVSESSIGANTRRLEATTGAGSLERTLALETIVHSVSAILRSSEDDVVAALQRTLENQKDLERELNALRQSQLAAVVDELYSSAHDGCLVERLDGFTGDQLRQMVADLSSRSLRLSILLGVTPDGKVAVAVATDGVNDAVAIVKALGSIVNGGGGGSARLALAGGRDVSAIESCLAAAQLYAQ
jgi:alanyl-tRNA synthetase